ncbi:hypothetical protein GCM10009809_17000 [Isoptericola hypogeus]|uniref:Uncharacterized protein n=1 Tax=Isoptericola hypogeus TaxID=300179 RepID=A0ABP4VF44_9MICO
MSRRRTTTRAVAACLGTAALAVGAALATTVAPAAGSAAGSTAAASEAQNLPGVPEPGASASTWEEWAAQEQADAKATDWAADAAARGCELEDVTISMEVDREYNLAMGAPADLRTHRVELLEDCADLGASTSGSAAEGTASRVGTLGASTAGLPSGNQCDSTSGPGTICLSKSSGRIYASWKYRGSGSVSGFLRVYRVSTGSDGCPTGSTWLTGPDSTWGSGDTRTVSKTRTSAGGYSAYIWKKVLVGHTDWGATCASL